MEERHELEQYFFDADTVTRFADLLQAEKCCVLCAPTLGAELERRGADVTILDVDERFRHLKGFRHWDFYRPERLEKRFDLIFCDPPFFNVSLSQLFDAIRVLSHYDFTQRIVVSYLVRRRHAVMGTFKPFGLRPTGVHPGYRTVKKCERNDIELFANFAIGGDEG